MAGTIEDLLFSGAGNLISSGINYAFQSMAANKNFELAEKSAESQYQRQLDFWNLQNTYNSPEKQVNRRLAAGLSPVEGVDSGNASQLSTVPGNEVGKNGALQFQSSVDLLESMRTIQDIRNLGKTGNRLDAEVANLLAEGVLLGIEKDLKKAGHKELAQKIESLRIANERGRKENKYLYTDEYYSTTLNTMLANLKKLGADANISAKDWQNYNLTGVNPARMSKQDMFIASAINAILQIIGITPDSPNGIWRQLFGN